MERDLVAEGDPVAEVAARLGHGLPTGVAGALPEQPAAEITRTPAIRSWGSRERLRLFCIGDPFGKEVLVKVMLEDPGA